MADFVENPQFIEVTGIKLPVFWRSLTYAHTREDGMYCEATFSNDKKHRYRLLRRWDSSKPTCTWIMLNPSTADEKVDDPTIRRCIEFAKDWGYGSIIVVNLFAYRATNPKELKKLSFIEAQGEQNGAFILNAHRESDLVVAAWGANGNLWRQGPFVLKCLQNVRVLDLTKDGHPRHPLYLKKTLKPVPYP